MKITRYSVPLFLSLMVSTMSFAQEKPQITEKEIPASPVEQHVPEEESSPVIVANLKAAYQQSVDYEDRVSAIIFATRLAVAAPQEAGQWKQELAGLYFSGRNFSACLKVMEDLKAMQDGKLTLAQLEVKALSHEALGQKDAAIETWEKAREINPGAVHSMRLAGLYLEADKLDEAEASIAAGFSAEDIDESVIPLPKSSNEMQEIPIKAVLHNMKYQLILKRDINALPEARAELQAALELAPDFEIAKRNLKAISE